MHNLEQNLAFDEKVILIPEGDDSFLKIVLAFNAILLLVAGGIGIYFSLDSFTLQDIYIFTTVIFAAIIFDSAFFVIIFKQKYIITNKRIIRKCIIPSLGAELDITEITEVTTNKTIFHRNNNVGNISCRLEGKDPFLIANIKNPLDVKGTIENLIEKKRNT